MGRQRNFCGRLSGSAGALAWQLSEQSKQVWRTHKCPQHDTRARRSGCDCTSARQLLAQRRRVNGTGSPSDRGLEPREGRVATTDTRRKPDKRILGRKAPSVLTPLLWPWELTTWTSTQET